MALALRRRAPELLVGRIEYAIAKWGFIESDDTLVKGKEGENLLKMIEQIRALSPERSCHAADLYRAPEQTGPTRQGYRS